MTMRVPTEPATALRIRHLLTVTEFREAPDTGQITGMLTALADIQHIEPMFSFVQQTSTTLDLLQALTNIPLATDAGDIHITKGIITWSRPDGGAIIIDESYTIPALVRLIRLWLRIRLMQVLQQNDFKTFIKKEEAERDDVVWFDGDVSSIAMWADALLGMIGVEDKGTGQPEIMHGQVIISKDPQGGAFF